MKKKKSWDFTVKEKEEGMEGEKLWKERRKEGKGKKERRKERKKGGRKEGIKEERE